MLDGVRNSPRVRALRGGIEAAIAGNEISALEGAEDLVRAFVADVPVIWPPARRPALGAGLPSGPSVADTGRDVHRLAKPGVRRARRARIVDALDGRVGCAMRKPFAEVTARTQANRLRALAARALPAWGLADASLRLLNHGYNTTFRVDAADGRRFALRVNMIPTKTEAHLLAEVAWLAALSAETDLQVPTPQRTRDGAWAARGAQPRPRPRPAGGAVLLAGGPQRGLQTAAPAGARGGRGDGVAARPRRALAIRPRAPRCRCSTTCSPICPTGSATIPRAGRRRQRGADRGVGPRAGAAGPGLRRGRPIPLHADLHGGNLKWHRRPAQRLRLRRCRPRRSGARPGHRGLLPARRRRRRGRPARGLRGRPAVAGGERRGLRGHGRRPQPAAGGRPDRAAQRRTAGDDPRLRGGGSPCAAAALAGHRPVPPRTTRARPAPGPITTPSHPGAGGPRTTSGTTVA